LPGLLELFVAGAFGEFFSVGPGVAGGAVTGEEATGTGVGVGAAGVVTTGVAAFSTPLGIPAGLRAVDGRGAELLGRAAAGAAGWLRIGAGTAVGVAAWCTGRGAGG